jgi:penicillin-insensitive murein endopeptidase
MTTAWIRAKSSEKNITKKDYKGSDSRIKKARSLPPWGKGFTTYSWFGAAIGRQHGHHKVIQTLIDALEKAGDASQATFVVAEIGWPNGRSLEGHASHRKGLHVDILTPVHDIKTKKSRRLPSNITNIWGYCWKIDKKTHEVVGKEWEIKSNLISKKKLEWAKGPYCPKTQESLELEVDFEAMQELIVNMQREARKNGLVLSKVILDKSFISKLNVSNVRLVHNVWVRHDEHLHFQFRHK